MGKTTHKEKEYNLNLSTSKHGKIIGDIRYIDLVVERYEFGTKFEETNYEALIEGAWKAEKILYSDISGALQLDMNNFWGTDRHERSPNPYSPDFQKDEFSKWRIKSNRKWAIPAEAYFQGVEWYPYDGFQKFSTQVITRQTDKGYYGVIKIDAFVIDDTIPGKRLGCLLDVIHRNAQEYNPFKQEKEGILLAVGTRIAVPYGLDFRKTLEDVRIFDYAGKSTLMGFNDIRENKLPFKSINIKDRCDDCNYRDR